MLARAGRRLIIMKFDEHSWAANLRITGLAYPLSNLRHLRASRCVLLERGQICAVSSAIYRGYPLYVNNNWLIS